MTDRAGEEQLPRTDAEVAERDVAALTARLRAVEGERDEIRRELESHADQAEQLLSAAKREAVEADEATAKIFLTAQALRDGLAHAEQRVTEWEKDFNTLSRECGGILGAQALKQRVAALEDALRHVSVTSSRYRSHAGGCQATCTCGAVEDDKLVKNEIGRVVQRALTPPPPAQEEEK